MAEEFVNRLIGIEKKIDGLGETLMRMITILGNVTEIKSDLRVVVKEEVLEGIKTIPAPTPPVPGVTKEDLVDVISNLPKADGGGTGISAEEVSQIVKAELAGVLEVFLSSISELREELHGKIESIEIPTPVVVAPATSSPDSVADVEPVAMAGAPLAADRGMKVADQLEVIASSLKMGCVAGDVLDVMIEVKGEIMKIVPSDPIMVKIDKWAGIVSTYSKRHELSAKDTRNIKKDIQDEIPKYRPA